MQRTLYRLVIGLVGLAVRSGRAKDLEIIVLRHQLSVLRRQVDPLAINDDDRTLLAAVAQALSRRAREGWIVTPDTLLRWHRRRVARHWTYPRRRPGRPAAMAIRQLVVDMAADNPTWGYRRIHGELVGVGHRLGASTVWRILKEQGVAPAPQRASVTWSDFLRSQAAVACDFACVDTVALRRYSLLFFIDIQTRRAFYAGITAHPTGAWTTQAARNLFLRHDRELVGCKALVRDRGSQFTAAFDEVFRTEGVKVLRPRFEHRSPTRSPSDGSAPCAASSSIAPSCGTADSSSGSLSTSSITTTSTDPIGHSTNARLAQPCRVRSRPRAAGRSCDDQADAMA